MQIVSPRPLKELAGLIERRWGIPVNYEDAEWSLQQSEDISSRLKVARPVFVPQTSTIRFPEIRSEISALQHGTLRVMSAAELTTRSDRAMLAIQAAIHSQSTTANGVIDRAAPPDFTVRRTARGLLIQAVRVDTPSLLDRTISVVVNGSGYDFVEEVCKQLTASAGTKVVPGTVPTSMLGNGQVRLNATATGRDILSQGLAQLEESPAAGRVSLDWKLLYGAEEKMYVLNLNIVATEEDLPLGGKTWRIVQRAAAK